MSIFNITFSHVNSKILFYSIQRVCTKRSELYNCANKYIQDVSGCLYPSENEIYGKADRISRNLLELICAQDENDFALFNADSELQKCAESNQFKIRTCVNKSIYSVAKRLLEKLIESEHFAFEMEAEDCK